MGINSSKAPLLEDPTSTNPSTSNDAYYTNDNDEYNNESSSPCFNCFFLFCNHHEDDPKNDRRTNTKNIFNNKKNVDKFGTPLPSTPLHIIHRLRNQNKNGHSKNNNSIDPLRPKYVYRGLGLEVEDSIRYLQNTTNNHTTSATGADFDIIHQGDDGEKLLYQKYKICEVLGVGSTSTCHRCIHKQTGNQYACKIIHKSEIEKRYSGMINQFLSEIQALSSLRHPNIISLYDVFATDEKIYIIMELMSGGELFDYVVKRGTLNEAEASHIIRMVTSALVYIHSERLVHRDLKPENLMLTHSPIIDKHSLNNNHDHDKDIQVKIIDFGLSKRMHEPLATTFLGTKGYLAPEMLQRRQYSEAVDCWSLGIICFVLLCGCLPFDDDPTTVPSDDIIKSRFILRFPRWAKDLSPSAKDLLRHLLDVNPKSRYTALQALNHPWVAGKTASETKLLASPGKIHLTPNQYRKNRIHNNFGPNTDYDNNNNNNAPTSNIQKYLKPTAAISSDQGDDRDNEGNSAITNRQYMNQIMADRAKGNAFHQNTRQQQPHRQLVRKLSI